VRACVGMDKAMTLTISIRPHLPICIVSRHEKGKKKLDDRMILAVRPSQISCLYHTPSSISFVTANE
jgi:hypothetical protein